MTDSQNKPVLRRPVNRSREIMLHNLRDAIGPVKIWRRIGGEWVVCQSSRWALASAPTVGEAVERAWFRFAAGSTHRCKSARDARRELDCEVFRTGMRRLGWDDRAKDQHQ